MNTALRFLMGTTIFAACTGCSGTRLDSGNSALNETGETVKVKVDYLCEERIKSFPRLQVGLAMGDELGSLVAHVVKKGRSGPRTLVSVAKVEFSTNQEDFENPVSIYTSTKPKMKLEIPNDLSDSFLTISLDGLESKRPMESHKSDDGYQHLISYKK